MGYVTKEIRSTIEDMFASHSEVHDYLKSLDTFGRFVEEKILPVENETKKHRAQDTISLVRQGLQLNKPIEEILAEIEHQRKMPIETLMLPASFLSPMTYTTAIGGEAFPYAVYIAHLETLAKASGSAEVTHAISGTAMEVLRHNYDGMKENLKLALEDIMSGKQLAAFCLTEGEVSGSNIFKEMTTTATLEGDEYILKGKKMFITNSGIAKYYIVFAKYNGEVSAFLVEKDTKGFDIRQKKKITVENSVFAELEFNDVRIPKENLIGKEGEGAIYAMRALNSGRITIAAFALGVAQRALDEYMDIAVNGKMLDKKQLIEYQTNANTGAELYARVNATRQLMYRAAVLKDRFDRDTKNKPLLDEYVLASNSAKLLAADLAMDASFALISIGGGGSVLPETINTTLWMDGLLSYFGEAVPDRLKATISGFMRKSYSS